MKRALGVLLFAAAPLLLGVLPGCDEATGPLVRPQTLAGIVRDAAGDSVPGAEIGIVYGLTVTDEAIVPPDLPAVLPTALRLAQNFPNPFATATAFLFQLPVPADVRLELMDQLGRPVLTLLEGAHAAGSHLLVWDNETVPGSGAVLPNGYYLARLQTLQDDSVTATAVIHGLLCNEADPDLLSPNALTGAVGEFEIPFPEIAAGISIPRTGATATEVLDWIRVPRRLQVVARDGGLHTVKQVDLGDMTRWQYVEFRLPVP